MGINRTFKMKELEKEFYYRFCFNWCYELYSSTTYNIDDLIGDNFFDDNLRDELEYYI